MLCNWVKLDMNFNNLKGSQCFLGGKGGSGMGVVWLGRERRGRGVVRERRGRGVVREKEERERCG